MLFISETDERNYGENDLLWNVGIWSFLRLYTRYQTCSAGDSLGKKSWYVILHAYYSWQNCAPHRTILVEKCHFTLNSILLLVIKCKKSREIICRTSVVLSDLTLVFLDRLSGCFFVFKWKSWATTSPCEHSIKGKVRKIYSDYLERHNVLFLLIGLFFHFVLGFAKYQPYWSLHGINCCQSNFSKRHDPSSSPTSRGQAPAFKVWFFKIIIIGIQYMLKGKKGWPKTNWNQTLTACCEICLWFKTIKLWLLSKLFQYTLRSFLIILRLWILIPLSIIYALLVVVIPLSKEGYICFCFSFLCSILCCPVFFFFFLSSEK